MLSASEVEDATRRHVSRTQPHFPSLDVNIVLPLPPPLQLTQNFAGLRFQIFLLQPAMHAFHQESQVLVRKIAALFVL